MPSKSLLSFLLFLALLSCTLAGPKETHQALCDLYFPGFLSGQEKEELEAESWQALSQDEQLSSTWQLLEGLEALDERARWKRLSEFPALLQLTIRQKYATWLYQGERGKRWAGISVERPRPFQVSPDFPKLESGALRLSHDKIQAQGKLDFLIVGSGPAGSVLGHELSAAGFRVLLVDMGSFVWPEGLDTREVPELKIGGGSVPTEKSLILVRNGQAVGGGSTVNVDLAFSPLLDFVQERFESWRRQGLIQVDQWTREDMALAYAWVEQTIGTRRPELSEVNANNDILRRGAKALGLEPCLYDLNTLAGEDLDTNKLSATKQLLLPAMTRERGALLVLPDFEADGIQLEGRRAVAVQGHFEPAWSHPKVWKNPYQLDFELGRSYQIQAECIILCAGAQGSAALLLRSQIGGDEVGRGVVLHPSMPFIGKFKKSIDAQLGTDSTIYAVDPGGFLYECMSAGPDYLAALFMGTGAEMGKRVQDYRYFGGFGVLLVDEPEPSNRVQLDAQGEAEVVYALSDSEKKRFAKGVLTSLKIMLAAGAEEVYLPSAETLLEASGPGGVTPITNVQEAETAVSALRFLPGATLLTSAHMQSTCKIGSSPENSVVGPDLKVWGTDNLYICDASIFPSSVGANPMQTIYTVAKITADKFIARPSGR